MKMNVTLSEFKAIKKLAAERKAKRQAKALTLWPIERKPRKLRAIKTPRQRLRARLDALWSILIRRRDVRLYSGICVICHNRPIQVAYHIVSRKDDATRWDMDNGCGSCAPCNYFEFLNRGHKVRDKHIAIFGIERVEWLEARARVIANFSLQELEDIEVDLKRRIQTGDYQ